MNLRSCLGVLVVLLGGAVVVRADSALPGWLLDAAKQANPPLAAGVPAAVVLDDTEYDVKADGRVVETRRFAVRVISRSGNDHATGSVEYVEKGDKVVSAGAWLVRAGKEIRPPKKREWVDLTDGSSGSIFSESRRRSIGYTDLALIGDVFGFETVVERRMLFAQFGMSWESTLPEGLVRHRLRMPSGWSFTAMVTGPAADRVTRRDDGPQSAVWELADLPFRPDEPSMSDTARVAARLYVDLHPVVAPGGGSLLQFKSWAEMANWKLGLYEGQCDSSPALAETVRQLTAGCPDAVSRIRAISRYVQQLRYVGVYRGLSIGHGYKPRKASEVHAKGWGDCKDKANLLRAMLKQAGVESFMVTAQNGGGREIVEQWPSPMQFNHAILAIRVDDAVDLPAVVDVPKLGRLLFFDATDPDVLLGDIPIYLQGTKVHPSMPGSDALVTLPVLPLESSHLLERKVDLVLGPTGAVSGECVYGGPGSVGALYRELLRSNSAKDFRTTITERIAGAVSGAVLTDLSTDDDPVTGVCRVRVRFTAQRFAQPMPGGLAVVRLDVLRRDTVPTFPEKDRTSPIGLKPRLVRDEMTLKLPEHCIVDELPAPVELASPYGRYSSACEVRDGAVVTHRVLQLEDRIVPVSEYAALRKFFSDVAKADRSSVVLRQAAPAK